MLWKESSFFYAVIINGMGETQTVEEFAQHDNPYLALAEVKRRADGFTFIRNERGVSCFPVKALKYFERREKERPKESKKK